MHVWVDSISLGSVDSSGVSIKTGRAFTCVCVCISQHNFIFFSNMDLSNNSNSTTNNFYICITESYLINQLTTLSFHIQARELVIIVVFGSKTTTKTHTRITFRICYIYFSIIQASCVLHSVYLFFSS